MVRGVKAGLVQAEEVRGAGEGRMEGSRRLTGLSMRGPTISELADEG